MLEELLSSDINDIIDNRILSRLWSIFNLKMCESFEFELEAMISLNPIILNTNDLIKYYNPVPYQKGAAFFRSLSMLVGKKVFSSILKKVCNFYTHHNISTSILYNLVKVMIRNSDEDDICMLEESDLEKYWFDNLTLPFYSCIKISSFNYRPEQKALDVNFEDISSQMPFDIKFKQDYFFSGPEEEVIDLEDSSLKKALSCHSAEEFITQQIQPAHYINKTTIARKTNFFKVTVLDVNCKVIFESWCKLWTPDTKRFTIPDIEIEPRAVILNGLGESYSRVFLDDKSLTFLFAERRILTLENPDTRVSLYLTLSASPQLSSWHDHMEQCLMQESKLIQKIVSPKFIVKPVD